MFPLVPHWDVLSIAWKCSKYRFWVCSNDLVLRTSPLWRVSDFFPNDVLSICPSLYIHTYIQAGRPAGNRYSSMIHQWPMDRSQVSWFPQLPFLVPRAPCAPRKLRSVSGTQHEGLWQGFAVAPWPRPLRSPPPCGPCSECDVSMDGDRVEGIWV